MTHFRSNHWYILEICLTMLVLIGQASSSESSRQEFRLRRAIYGADVHPPKPSSATLKGYSSLVVFGASWADNGHPRESRLSWSLKGQPYFKGRHCDGVIWAEYLSNGLLTGKKIPLLDYAIAGSIASEKKLEHLGIPDTEAQVKHYITDVESAKVDRGHGSVLHCWWTGINQIEIIWNRTIRMDPSLNRTDFLKKADYLIDQQVAALKSQLTSLRANQAINHLPGNYLILPVAPLETVLKFRNQANYLSQHDARLSALYLNLVGKLTRRYNQGIRQIVKEIGANITSQATVGWVRTLDFEDFWKDVNAQPKKYGLEILDRACVRVVHKTAIACSEPEKYIYWDTLHPTTAMHRVMAQEFLHTINSSHEAPFRSAVE